MQIFRTAVISLAIGWLGLGHGWAQGTDTAVTGSDSAVALPPRIERFVTDLAAMQNLSANFQQTVVSAGRSRTSSGIFTIARPGLMRWETQKPYPQLQLLNAREFWVFDPELAQATVRSVQSSAVSGIAGLLFNQDEARPRAVLLDRYTLKELGERAGLFWIEIEPKVEDPGVQKLSVGLDSQGQMKRFEVLDRLGQMTRVELSQVKINAAVSPQTFEFIVPKGVSVLRGP